MSICLEPEELRDLISGAVPVRKWAIHQAGEPGRLLEATLGSQVAGLMLLGIEAHTHFYDSNEQAAEYLRSVLEAAE